MKYTAGFILLPLLLLYYCNTPDNIIRSHNYSTIPLKISNLKKYYKVKTKILDTEYEIYDVNVHNRSIPGPTDRNYKIIIKVDEKDIPEWQKDERTTSFPVDYQWAVDLLDQNNNTNISLSGPTKQYKTGKREMVIFNKTGTIVINIVQH